MLTVKNLNVGFVDFKLKDVNFHLPKGEVMGVVGANASGKSTLLKSILNVYSAQTSGEVHIGGFNVNEDERGAKDLVGFVFDENFFQPGFTVEENANIVGKFYSKYDHELFLKYIFEYGIDKGMKLKKLSKGNILKFQLAFSLSHDAKLFIFDEPTANLDPEFANEFNSILSDLVEDGEKSVIISTHITETLDLLADSILFLDRGIQKFCMPILDMLEQYKILEGEEYMFNNLDREQIIFLEKTEYNTKALIKQKKYSKLPYGFNVEEPNIGDIVYYMIRGDFKNV